MALLPIKSPLILSILAVPVEPNAPWICMAPPPAEICFLLIYSVVPSPPMYSAWTLFLIKSTSIVPISVPPYNANAPPFAVALFATVELLMIVLFDAVPAIRSIFPLLYKIAPWPWTSFSSYTVLFRVIVLPSAGSSIINSIRCWSLIFIIPPSRLWLSSMSY